MNNQYEVLSPWAEIDPIPLRGISPRLIDLTGKKIGLFCNYKRAARPILTVVEQKLKEKFPTSETSWFVQKQGMPILKEYGHCDATKEYACVVILRDRQPTLYTLPPDLTTNQAEYHAILCALRKALRCGYKEFCLSTDSQLAVRQLEGSYKIKSQPLQVLATEVAKLAQQFTDLEIKWVRRGDNQAGKVLGD